ncbi:guanine nucleotide binding protein, alpha subunit [Rhizoclosmatium globosum]|uniref:Guanine nucleotide binding protein, alpha subunit n=1 Tax=Rhizoclosmatium globosum TaxID=329046 RepID=A0A1Y2BQB9_9FUNG|nr:guanine nucleotide binding protein, alpha subunit [Rhizoclosmatium globosum]|eukprot:ORY36930.1 guanine nucleotide binding protein, alpha subunit [Rhizoclosmatium globosum]
MTYAEDTESRRISRAIDTQLTSERRRLEALRPVKLLLLGTGESGKSTILKQMKLIYDTGFSPEEIQTYRSSIILNLFSCVKTLAVQMDNLKIPYGFITPDTVDSDPDEPLPPQSNNVRRRSSLAFDETRQSLSRSKSPVISRLSTYVVTGVDSYGGGARKGCNYTLQSQDAASQYERFGGINQIGSIPDFGRSMKAMPLSTFGFGKDEIITAQQIDDFEGFWNDSGVQYCFSRSSEFGLMECCEYLMKNLRRIGAPEYIPTKDDILLSRLKTTAISETRFKIKDVEYRVFDVGGQRSQRKKWASLFDDVNAIIFVVAISSYDQVCYEDHSVNRVVEALQVFKSIINHSAFVNTGIILFLNKIDLFKIKLNVSPVSDYFPSYKGTSRFEESIEYFLEMFRAANTDPERRIQHHLTWATDTKQTRKVLDSVCKCIQEANLKDCGLE